MKNPLAMQERYLQDPLPIRLGGLAANLARIESFSDHDGHCEAVEYLLNESKYFIEWTALDADATVQSELAELQRQLAQWQYSLSAIWPDRAKRSTVAHEAGKWSQRVLAASGLLE